MVNSQLVDWIKQGKSGGQGLAELRNTLLQKGYNQTEVDEAINAVDSAQDTKKATPTNSGDNKSKKKKILVSAIIAAAIILISLWLFVPKEIKI